jgi:hypothetical protein
MLVVIKFVPITFLYYKLGGPKYERKVEVWGSLKVRNHRSGHMRFNIIKRNLVKMKFHVGVDS